MTDDLSHAAVRELLGPAVLGSLSVQEQALLEAHLASCTACRDEHASLSRVVGALGLLDTDEAVSGTLLPSPHLIDTTVRALGDERRGARSRLRRVQALCAAAAAVAVLAAGVTTAQALSDAPKAVVPTTMQIQTADGITATAGYIPHTWGVEVRLVGEGFTAGGRYRVVVQDRQGNAVSAGEFLGTGDRQLTCNLNSSVLATDAAAFVVTSEDGSQVVAGTIVA